MNNHRNWSDTALSTWNKKLNNEPQPVLPHTLCNTTPYPINPSKPSTTKSPANRSSVTSSTKTSPIPLLYQEPRFINKISSRNSEGPIPLFSPAENTMAPPPFVMNHCPCDIQFPATPAMQQPMFSSTTAPFEPVFSNITPNVHVMPGYLPQGPINSYDSAGLSYPNAFPRQGQLQPPYFDSMPGQVHLNQPIYSQDIHSVALRFLQSVLDERYSQYATHNGTTVNGMKQASPAVPGEATCFKQNVENGYTTSAADSHLNPNMEAGTPNLASSSSSIRILRRPNRNSNESKNFSFNDINAQNKPNYMRTFEEREADYAAARLRIMGSAYPEETEDEKIEQTNSANTTEEECQPALTIENK